MPKILEISIRKHAKKYPIFDKNMSSSRGLDFEFCIFKFEFLRISGQYFRSSMSNSNFFRVPYNSNSVRVRVKLDHNTTKEADAENTCLKTLWFKQTTTGCFTKFAKFSRAIAPKLLNRFPKPIQHFFTLSRPFVTGCNSYPVLLGLVSRVAFVAEVDFHLMKSRLIGSNMKFEKMNFWAQ